MPDDPTPAQGQETTPPVGPASTKEPVVLPTDGATPQPGPTPQTPSWQEELDKLDAADLRRHPKIAGLIGSEAQRLWQQKTKTDTETAQRKAREEQERAFMDLVEGNTDYIKEHHPLVYQRYESAQQERMSRGLAGIRESTIKEIGETIGQVLQELPEGRQMMSDDSAMTSLASALQNKPDHEVIAIVIQHAADYMTEQRVKKAVETAITKRDKEWEEKLAKDREATRQEERAKHLASSHAPDGKAPKREPAKMNVIEMSDADFEKWWTTRNS